MVKKHRKGGPGRKANKDGPSGRVDASVPTEDSSREVIDGGVPRPSNDTKPEVEPIPTTDETPEMPIPEEPTTLDKIKTAVIGKARNPFDSSLFYKLSLISVLAWIGLGADGLSSSAYGPQEAYLFLGEHIYLAIFVALATVITIIVIAASYSQIIEHFPTGGGGYVVSSKLLSPTWGMVAGSALLIDYILTIAVSIAACSDAIFSFVPGNYHSLKIGFSVVLIVTLIWLNLRGVKESVIPLVPIFLLFIVTHAIVFIWAIGSHAFGMGTFASETGGDINGAMADLGLFGMLFVILRAYSMGAGTYTGLEAVSNGIPILRKPRVKTAKRTMVYMAVSLSLVVFCLMFAFLLYDVKFVPGKTLNAVLFEKIASEWGVGWGYSFVIVILITEGLILFVAAQTGFLDGPRVLASMASDRWFPSRFAFLSDRLVTHNGIFLMGLAAVFVVLVTGGSIVILVILYSINVFITMTLSQAGMVRYWLTAGKKEKHWIRGFAINGLGMSLAGFILITLVYFKFYDGGWATLAVTGGLIVICLMVRQHYDSTSVLLNKLDKHAEKEGYYTIYDNRDGIIVEHSPDGTIQSQSYDPADCMYSQSYEPMEYAHDLADTLFTDEHVLEPGSDAEGTHTHLHKGVKKKGRKHRHKAACQHYQIISLKKDYDTHAKTAVMLVNGFNGLGLHTLQNVQKMFGGIFKNFIFIQVGIIDAGNYKGAREIKRLQEHVRGELERYVSIMHARGYYAQGIACLGVDVVDEVARLTPRIMEHFPNSVFFGGQLVFPHETYLTRLLHNNIVFALQRRFYHQGVSFVILPIRV